MKWPLCRECLWTRTEVLFDHSTNYSFVYLLRPNPWAKSWLTNVVEHTSNIYRLKKFLNIKFLKYIRQILSLKVKQRHTMSILVTYVLQKSPNYHTSNKLSDKLSLLVETIRSCCYFRTVENKHIVKHVYSALWCNETSVPSLHL